MYCKIITEQCIACGICQLQAPTYFDYSDDGIVQFIDEPERSRLTIPTILQKEVLQAIKKCPTRALVLEEKNI